MKVSVVIPVFNERTTIAEVIRRVQALPIDKEILVVDDGSLDGTRDVLSSFDGVEGVRILQTLVNGGKGAAVRMGFSQASGDIVVIQDADLELDPTCLPALCAPLERGEADAVLGSRFLNGRRGPLLSYLANRSLTGLTNALYGSRLTDMETCYKAIRADIIPTLGLRARRFEIEPEIVGALLRGGWRVAELPVSYSPRDRRHGKKLRYRDGLAAAVTLFRGRFFHHSG